MYMAMTFSFNRGCLVAWGCLGGQDLFFTVFDGIIRPSVRKEER